MKLKHYLTKYGIRMAVIVLILALVIGASAALRSGRAGFLQNANGTMMGPLQRATTALYGWMERLYGYIYDYDLILEENNSLRAENAALREQVREYANLEEENLRLRTLFDWAQHQTNMTLESAKIVSWDPSNYISAFTISKGSDSGIELGDCVITEYGALVGQVMELGTDWATIRSIIDVDMDVGALVGVYSYAGMVTGDFALMRQGQTRLAYLTSGAQIFAGDEVLTSGRGGSFPPGLMIGVITAVMTENGGQATYGVIQPTVDVSRLSQIFIIKDFEIIE
ncbi:MAG: rod shape-determining protein MreC [Oscillospiraceae bacterium]|nr:rod shape-determining protein MreC [Oscillospiraceae bacterium]